VHHGGKITTVVEDHVGGSSIGESVDGLLNAPEVLLLGLSLPGEDGDAAVYEIASEYKMMSQEHHGGTEARRNERLT